MSKHDKTQRLAPEKPLDIFIVLPSPLNTFSTVSWGERHESKRGFSRERGFGLAFCLLPAAEGSSLGQDLCSFSKESPGQMLSGIVYINPSLG